MIKYKENLDNQLNEKQFINNTMTEAEKKMNKNLINEIMNSEMMKK